MPAPRLSGYAMLAPLFYLYPQAPEFGLQLYEAGVRDLRWDPRSNTLFQAFDDPRWLTMTLMLAREAGDVTTERHLKAVAEQECGPDFFADDEDRFAWKFGLDDPHPRGQLNGLLILSEIGGPGAWTKVYQGRHESQFDLPTVESVDYPNLGICAAFNDVTDSTLHVSTYAATAARRGEATRRKVSQLPDPKRVQVFCDDHEFSDWGVVGDGTIEINSTIDTHRFRIVGIAASATTTAERNGDTIAATGARSAGAENIATTRAYYRPAVPPSCGCC